MADAERNFIQNRVNLPTSKTSAEISRDIPPEIRARAFFSARVAEAHILERFRKISDAYSSGRIGRDEARNLLLQYAVANGKDDGTQALKNLASTARLNLILDQNAKMARAVGQYEAMHRPANLKMFPYVIYRASVGSKDPRGDHQKYDGMVIDKRDPWLKTHWPPWEFGCNCDLSNCTAKKAEKLGVKPMTPADKVKIDSRSGFAFDPSEGLKIVNISSVKNPHIRGHIREMAEIEFGDQIQFFSQNNFARITPQRYLTFEDVGLPSAKTWVASPSPSRISPDEAREKLENEFEIIAPDGRKVIMGQSVLKHWIEEENKLQSDILSRLACLDYAVETVLHPVERWDQESQVRYLKVFQKSSGGFEGCLVAVTNDGNCRTYFLPKINKIDKAREGKDYKIF